MVRRPPGRRRLGHAGAPGRVPALPRPVLHADAAALRGVRPVDPGRISLGRLDELLATPSSTPVPRRTRRATDSGSATWPSTMCASPTPPPLPRRCAGSTSTIAPGEMVALVGTTGAGKSTFVKLVARFYDPTVGSCAGRRPRPARRSTCPRYRRQLGYVPQEPFLFPGTIRSNIAYGRPDASDLEIERAARAVGAHDLVAAMPERLLTPVAEAGRSLSAGQRQLLCLARAAARRSDDPDPRRGDIEPRPGH